MDHKNKGHRMVGDEFGRREHWNNDNKSHLWRTCHLPAVEQVCSKAFRFLIYDYLKGNQYFFFTEEETKTQ